MLKSVEMKQELEQLNNKAKALLDSKKAKLEDIQGVNNEIETLQAKIAVQEKIETDEKSNAQNLNPIPQPAAEIPTYKDAFMKAIRGYNLSGEERELLAANYVKGLNNKMSAGTGADGGYIIPEDITTAINQLKMTVDNLEQYVNVQPVSTNKGSRTLEKRADSTPFLPLSEYGDPNAMAEMDSPQFDRLDYVIDDYAGFLPVANDILNDTDQALEGYLRQWIAKKSKATRNSLILAALNSLAKTAITDIDGIKDILNVTLDPVFSVGATIFTNQDGYNYLDKLKDAEGKYLLQPDPTNATGKTLFGRRIVTLSNKTIPTAVAGNASNVPIIVGDLKEAVVLWDRQQMMLDMTTVGGNAWRSNSTEFRAIEREDVTLWDSEAVVYGQLDINPVA